MIETNTDRGKTAEWVSVEELNIDPYPTFARLRAEGPVMWAPALNRHMAASYDSSVQIEERPDLFTAYEPSRNSTMFRTMRGRPMNRKDDPDHMDDRNAIVPPLKPHAIKTLWTQVFEETSDRFLDAVIEAGPGVNFVTEFAGPFAADNLRQVIGFPNVTHVDMKRWSKALVDGIGNVTEDPEVWERAETANDEIETAADEVWSELSNEPNGTLLSGLIASGLSRERILTNIKLTISGGMNEPQNVVAAGIWALLRDPRQRALVEDGPYDYRAVFDETLRWQTPLGMFPRTVTQDTEFFGAHLRAGDKISALTGAANHDPTVFSRPEEFDLEREKKPHFAFGRGTHMCAGMWIAKASVGAVALPKIFRRLHGLALAPEREPYLRGWVFRGLKDLPLTWDRAERSTQE